jgi:hypothetical protein
MESEERAEREDLSPAEALASTSAARDILVRRVGVPWEWDAFSAAGTGLFMWLVMEPPYPWFILALAPWPIANVLIRQARQNRLGVAFDGLKRRTAGRQQWWILGVVLAVWGTAGVLDLVWGQTRVIPVAAGICAVLLFAFLRRFNRNLVAAIRDAP